MNHISSLRTLVPCCNKWSIPENIHLIDTDTTLKLIDCVCTQIRAYTTLQLRAKTTGNCKYWQSVVVILSASFLIPRERLIVNIQSTTDLNSYQLDMDTWASQAVKDSINGQSLIFNTAASQHGLFTTPPMLVFSIHYFVNSSLQSAQSQTQAATGAHALLRIIFKTLGLNRETEETKAQFWKIRVR